MSIRSLAWLLLVAVGCATTTETKKAEESVPATETEVSEDFSVRATASPINGEDGTLKSIAVDVTRFKTCSTYERRPGESEATRAKKKRMGRLQPVETKECNVEPYVGAVVLATGSSNSISATTDEKGHAVFDLTDAKAKLFAGYVVRDGKVEVPSQRLLVDGKEVGKTEALNPLFMTWVAERQKQRAEEEAAKEREQAALSEKETSTGRCDPKRYAVAQDYVRGAIDDLQAMSRNIAEYGNRYITFTEIGHETVVATEAGTKLSMKVGLGGQVHVVAVGFGKFALEVLDHNGYPATRESDIASAVASRRPGFYDSRMLNANNGERLAINVKGRGCVMVVAVRQH